MNPLGQVTYIATCPCCGLPATWTSQQLGHEPPYVSRITAIDHQESS